MLLSSITGSCIEMDEGKRIIVDIPSRTLSLVEGERIIKKYPIAVGKSYSQTPTGYYKVINKVVNPYYKKGNIRGGSKENPLGSRWIGFKYKYGIHGNSNPDSIGTYASGGCIRMYERDVQELYNSVDISTPVIIKYDLIKILKDVDKESTILLVYRDYYSKERNLKEKVIDKLKKLNLYENIPKERLDKLLNMMKTENTVFSPNWTLFINGNYITEDVINIDGEYFINKSKLEKYFNITIPSINLEEKGLINGERITEKIVNQKKYIPIKEIHGILGGEVNIDSDKQVISLNGNYLFLNDKLVKGVVYELTQKPLVPLLPILNEVGINLEITDNKVEFISNGIRLDYVVKSGQPYVSVETLKNKLSIKSEIYTVDNRLKLYIDPKILYNGSIYNGKFVNGDIYVPYEILTDFYTENPTEATFSESKIEDYKVIDINNKRYIHLDEISRLTIVTTDKYQTNIYIKKGNVQ
jgi:hypothetical protein